MPVGVLFSGLILAGLDKAILQEGELLSYPVSKAAIANWLSRNGRTFGSPLAVSCNEFSEPHSVPHSSQGLYCTQVLRKYVL